VPGLPRSKAGSCYLGIEEKSREMTASCLPGPGDNDADIIDCLPSHHHLTWDKCDVGQSSSGSVRRQGGRAWALSLPGSVGPAREAGACPDSWISFQPVA
jgi:hypothetical protein